MRVTEKCPYYARGRCGCECPIKNGYLHRKVMVPSQPRGILSPLACLDMFYYQHLGLLGVGGYLLGINHVGWGEHFWKEIEESLVDMQMHLTRVDNHCFFNLNMIHAAKGSRGEFVPCTWGCRVFPLRQRILLSVYLRRIQRAAKLFVWRKRILALCMGLHTRLGSNSLIQNLHGDALASVLLAATGRKCK